MRSRERSFISLLALIVLLPFYIYLTILIIQSYLFTLSENHPSAFNLLSIIRDLLSIIVILVAGVSSACKISDLIESYFDRRARSGHYRRQWLAKVSAETGNPGQDDPSSDSWLLESGLSDCAFLIDECGVKERLRVQSRRMTIPVIIVTEH